LGFLHLVFKEISLHDDILIRREGAWGVITLNRPKALNALTEDMCARIADALSQWRDAPDLEAVLIEGAGEKAFCVGGDIRWLYDTSRQDPARAAEFFRTEYKMNSLIHHFPKPYVALMDGFTMGGGVGVSISASHRVVTERTMFAMPETGIGLIPDVGGSWFLPRLDGGLGFYMGLMGARASGADCLYAKIATHFIAGDDLAGVREKLLAGSGAQKTIDDVLADAASKPESQFEKDRQVIDALFGDVPDMASLIAKLEAAKNNPDMQAFAEKMLKFLSRLSPSSLAISCELLNRAKGKAFDDCLRMEFRITKRLLEGSDFHEGVRALIIDKDKSPKWEPANLNEIDPEKIESFFAPLGREELNL
jgi:3-hydroxyisobutyryl-CoA hydrolase